MAALTFLRSLEAFRSLTREEAQRLLDGSARGRFDAGTTILRRGEVGDAMYVLLEGAVEIRVTGDDGRLRFTRYLAEGDIFGEMALLTGLDRTADVVATRSCTCLVIPQGELEARLHAHPALAAFLSDIVGQRILESDALRQVGKYHLLGEIGRGNMAIVFAGFHPVLNRGVAVKMLSYSLVSKPGVRERFTREAKVLASLRHPGIVQVFDTERAYGTYFIVMERLDGMDLSDWVEEHGPMPPDEVRRVIHDVAQALAYAHDAGVVHRDIKPSNVHRLPDGSCRLVDFGIASVDVEDPSDGDLFCSPAYVSPEVILGRPVDGRADIYSLGLTTYCLLAGAPPFSYDDTTRLFQAHLKDPVPAIEVEGMPADLAALVERSTQKRPDDRFQHASEIVTLLSTDPPSADHRETTLTLRYPEDARPRVEDALADVRRVLDPLPDVDVDVEDGRAR